MDRETATTIFNFPICPRVKTSLLSKRTLHIQPNIHIYTKVPQQQSIISPCRIACLQSPQTSVFTFCRQCEKPRYRLTKTRISRVCTPFKPSSRLYALKSFSEERVIIFLQRQKDRKTPYNTGARVFFFSSFICLVARLSGA